MKVALLVSGLMYGGGQQVVVDMLGRLGECADIDARLILLGCREPRLAGHAARVVDYDGRFNRPGSLLATSLRLRRVLGVERPDVLHTHGWDADMIGGLAVRGKRIRHVMHLHVLPQWLGRRSLSRPFRRVLTSAVRARRGTRIIAVSDAVRRQWAEGLGWPSDGITVVRNGVDTRRFSPEARAYRSEHGAATLGLASRLVEGKGVEVALQALAALGRQGMRPRFLVAGDGKLRHHLERFARELGVWDQVAFLGHVEDMPSFYRSIDIFLLPSMSEGMPLTVIEAMASGCAAVCTPVGGVPELIEDGRHGRLVPVGDEAALTAVLTELLHNPEVIGRLGSSAARRMAHDFSLERVADGVVAAYADCMREGR